MAVRFSPLSRRLSQVTEEFIDFARLEGLHQLGGVSNTTRSSSRMNN